MLRRLIQVSAFATFPVLAFAASAATREAVGPRTPLTFQDSGQYGGIPDCLLSEESPFDFLVAQAWPGLYSQGKAWNESLRKARAHGRRVIMVLNPFMKNAKGVPINLQSVFKEPTPPKLEAFLKVADDFLAAIDVDQLYAITVAEENIFWDGQLDRLNAVYDHLKRKYNVPVYQWYSPGIGGVPGARMPNLKADGWLIDEYGMSQPEFERLVRGYAIKRLPLVHIIWAAPDMKDFPFDKTFWEQREVCRKYNVPAAYFSYTGNGWAWDADAPARSKAAFDLCLHCARLPGKNLITQATDRELDRVPWGPATTKLACDPAAKSFASYEEVFARGEGRFLEKAEILGFANLRWDASPVELVGMKGGNVSATLIYRFQSPFDVKALRVYLKGAVQREAKGAVSVDLFCGEDAGPVARGNLEGTNLTLTVPGNRLRSRNCRLEITLSAASAPAGQVAAVLERLNVEADLSLPATKGITLRPDAAGGLEFSADLSDRAFLHTARIVNAAGLSPAQDGLAAAGVHGTVNKVEVIQRFTSASPMDLIRLSAEGKGDQPGAASQFGLGVSRDGRNILARKVSEGKGNKTIELDLAANKAFAGVRECYVHLQLVVACGVKTGPACSIGRYSLLGKTAADGRTASSGR